MKTIEPKQMADLEQRLFIRGIYSPLDLMEKAAENIVENIVKLVGLTKVAFIVGLGNNGGDGYVAARLYKQQGGQPFIWSLKGKRSKQCQAQKDRLYKLWPKLPHSYLGPDTYISKAKDLALIVDCLFGIGLNRPLEKQLISIIEDINLLPIKKLSIDLPSGIDGLTGKSHGAHIRANYTLTFHRPKIGLFLNQGLDSQGKLIIASIGIDEAKDDVKGALITHKSLVKKSLGSRKPSHHKGSYGHVLVLAGSFGMAGAAFFAAKAALSLGAGLVTIASDKQTIDILQGSLPSAMGLTLWGDKLKRESSLKILKKSMGNYDALVFGPGLGNRHYIGHIARYIAGLDIPVIWDARALYELKALRGCKLPFFHILTPHPGEAAKLLDVDIAHVSAHPESCLNNLSKLYGGSHILKNARTMFSTGGFLGINPTGTPAIAKGGSGDILTGILAALLAHHKGPLKAEDIFQIMASANYILGLAGEMAERNLGELSVFPEDIISHIPKALKYIKAD